jgi:hypothetical protein
MTSGNNQWQKLIENFIGNGYKPHDIQRIVMVYEMTKENDELLKKTLEAEENEHNH